MENGGNFKVNTIFEARLAQSGKTKPANLADGPSRNDLRLLHSLGAQEVEWSFPNVNRNLHDWMESPAQEHRLVE